MIRKFQTENEQTARTRSRLHVLARTVAPVTCIVVTRVKSVVRMRVGSDQIVELSMDGLFLLRFRKFQLFYLATIINREMS